MARLTAQQNQLLRQYLQQVDTQESLLDELTDHVACQIEQSMERGLTFDQALIAARSEATALAIRHLQRTMIRQGQIQLPHRRGSILSLSRSSYRSPGVDITSRSVKATLLLIALLSVLLTGWIVGSQHVLVSEFTVALLCPSLLIGFLQLITVKLRRPSYPSSQKRHHRFSYRYKSQ